MLKYYWNQIHFGWFAAAFRMTHDLRWQPV